MNKICFKFITVIVTVTMLLSLTSCNVSWLKSSKDFQNDELLWEDGKIRCRPTKAHYNEDGSFTLTVGVTNSTGFAKKLDTITVNSLKDVKNRNILEKNEFELDNEVILLSGKSRLVECKYDAEQVLLTTDLNELNSEISVLYYGCVKEGADPEKSDKEGFTMSIKEADFTETESLEGSIAIRNNYKTTQTPKNITFSIKTNTGEEVTLEDVIMTCDTEIKPSEMITIKFAVLPTKISEKIIENKLFDTLIPKYTITK